MPRIKPIDPAQADAQTTATLNAVHRKLGVLPNIFTTFARSPAALESYVQFSEQLSKGRLRAAQRERIALAVAQDNACQYCLSAHAAIGRGAGLSDEDIDQARQGRGETAQDAAITAFALQVVRQRGSLSDEELSAARDSGLDDGLIVEIIANVALNVLTNYLNKIAGTEVDFPALDLRLAA
jgi:uncharacterized peroxidase-related enzyme